MKCMYAASIVMGNIISNNTNANTNILPVDSYLFPIQEILGNYK